MSQIEEMAKALQILSTEDERAVAYEILLGNI
jgi:hypothetical protein